MVMLSFGLSGIMVTVVPPDDVGGFVSGVVVDVVGVVVPLFPGVGVVMLPPSTVVEEALVVVVIVTFPSLAIAVQVYSTPVFRIKGSGYFLTCSDEKFLLY